MQGGLGPPFLLCSWANNMKINENIILQGVLYERAHRYLAEEVNELRKQCIRYNNPEARVIYQRAASAFERFQGTGRLADALECVRQRG